MSNATDTENMSLDELLKSGAAETPHRPVVGKTTRATIAAAATVSGRAALYAQYRAYAARDTTPESIAGAVADGKKRSLVATCRGLCGMILNKNESVVAATERIRFGNGRALSHFSHVFGKTGCELVPVKMSRERAERECVDADRALASYDKTEDVRVAFVVPIAAEKPAAPTPAGKRK